MINLKTEADENSAHSKTKLKTLKKKCIMKVNGRFIQFYKMVQGKETKSIALL